MNISDGSKEKLAAGYKIRRENLSHRELTDIFLPI